MSLLEQCLWWLSIVAHGVLYFRLRHEGLHRIYRWFSVYLTFRVVRSLALAALPYVHLRRSPGLLFGVLPWLEFQVGHYRNTVYGWVWVTTEPLLDLLYVLIVLELVSLIVQKYRGIASLGRWAVLAGLALGILVASLSLSPDLSNSGGAFPILRYLLVLDRGLTSSLVLFLLFITGFLVWYPVPLSRNLVAHAAIYAVYFLCMSLAYMIRNVGGDPATAIANVALSAATVGCLLGWLFVLNRAGEQRAVTVRQRWDPDQQHHLMEQLASINASLLRAGRK